MLNLTYEYKLQPTKRQIELIEHTLDVCRSVWNFALRERKDWSESRKCKVNACSIRLEYILSADLKYPGYHQQSKSLTLAKKSNDFLKSVNAQVLQQTLRTLDRAFEAMTDRGFGYPRFKNRTRMRSFVYPQMLKNCLKSSQVKLPQLGWVKYRKSREIPDGFELKQARIVRKASGYFVMMSLSCDEQVPEIFPHGEPLGIDVGLEKYLATSTGELIKRPKFFNALHRKLQLLQRRLKHKKNKSSKKRAKLLQKIARLHQKISDTRKDFQFKLAHRLCDGVGMIFVEDIDFRVMAKGFLGKHTLDAGFGSRLFLGGDLRESFGRQFRQILQWVCWKRGVYFDQIDHRGTSQTCPNCGHHTGKKALSQRVHQCDNCGYTSNRDVASAQEICNRGLNAVGQPVLKNASRDVLTGIGVTQFS